MGHFAEHHKRRAHDATFCLLQDHTQELIDSDTGYDSVVRLLPHASRCFDLVMAGMTSHFGSKSNSNEDALSLIRLARLFEYASYGKEVGLGNYLLWLTDTSTESFREVHLINAEKLLSRVLESIEQSTFIEENVMSHRNMPTTTISSFQSLKLHVLRRKQIIYLALSHRRKLELTSQLILDIHLSRKQYLEALKTRAYITLFSRFSVVMEAIKILVDGVVIWLWWQVFEIWDDELTTQAIVTCQILIRVCGPFLPDSFYESVQGLDRTVSFLLNLIGGMLYGIIYHWYYNAPVRFMFISPSILTVVLFIIWKYRAYKREQAYKL
ncbi:hypothetical protein N7540_001139 [Penicillium herquei]|nr:hypothetical protein N7540_001139 [Penicillium herquei]